MHTFAVSHSHSDIIVAANESPSNDTIPPGDGSERQTSVEELLAFIEGGENEPATSSRAAKRARRKQKKQAASVPLSSSTNQNGLPTDEQNGVEKQHHQQNDTSDTKPHPHSNGALPTNGSQPSVSKKSKKSVNGTMATSFATDSLELEEMVSCLKPPLKHTYIRFDVCNIYNVMCLCA